MMLKLYAHWDLLLLESSGKFDIRVTWLTRLFAYLGA